MQWELSHVQDEKEQLTLHTRTMQAQVEAERSEKEQLHCQITSFHNALQVHQRSLAVAPSV